MKQLLEAIISERGRSALREIRSWFFRGNKIICPCCGRHSRKFLSFGVIRRPNALCPRCNSLERHRLLWLYLKMRTNFFSDKLRVLHFAPEYVFKKKFRTLSNLEYICADLRSQRATVRMDITEIACKEDTFDAILCNHVLEHISNDKKALRELFRILKPGGWAIIQSPIDNNREKTFEDFNIVLPKERELVFGRYDHVRVYGRDYKDRLEEAGFKVRVETFNKDLRADIIKKYGLPVNEDIYLCSKAMK